jgi:hypothetical protein
MRTIQIYVENQRLDLFADDTITVNSSTQNIYDIAKTFTDISKTFTVPATPNNNAIYEHYYNNDVDNVINHSKRRDARIEIDLVPFRTGRIQLEKASINNGSASDYTVTFYGDFVSLKDVILEDKLKDLDYSSLDHAYTGAEVQARVEDYDSVQYPLISSERVWQYGDATSNDISINAGAINFNELYPAISYKAILDLIQAKYSITFTGSWLNNSPRLEEAFLWFKNKEFNNFYSAPELITFAGTSGTPLFDNEIAVNYVEPASLLVAPYDYVGTDINHRIQIAINTASTSSYILDVYRDGLLINSFQNNPVNTYLVEVIPNQQGISYTYYFKLRSNASMSFDADVSYLIEYRLIETGVGSTLTSLTYTDNSGTITTSTFTNFASFAPDMKVLDFIGAVFRQFNLICYGDGVNTYRIEPLEDFYNSGQILDITKYVSLDSITVARPVLYNNISFEYEKSNSFMNAQFFDLFGREYGNLKSTFGYDGGDYIIKLPFETLLHNKFTSTDIQVGYCLGTQPEYKNYAPKPVSLYRNNKVTLTDTLKFDNGSIVTLASYVPFGQDTDDSGNNYTLSFGSEVSSYTLDIENNSLYKTYYERYLVNLYNRKTRLVTVTANLPVNILERLRLKDSLIIREKKYVINDMTTNLSTGEVKFTLLSNWRESAYYGQEFNISARSAILHYTKTIPLGVTITIGTVYETSFSTPSATTLNAGDTLTFVCSSNAGVARTNTYPITVNDNGVSTLQFIIINQAAP